MPANVSSVADYLGLLIKRDIFVDLLTDKEVCDMTMAQFSRDDDILLYQGRRRKRGKRRRKRRRKGRRKRRRQEDRGNHTYQKLGHTL